MKLRLALALGVASALFAGPAAAYVSFSASISSAYYSSYNSTLSITGYGRYSDTDCTPSYACDRSVQALFTLRQGYGRYGRVMAQADAETGQYSSSMRVKFRVPSCRFIPKYRSKTYTVVMEAVAPNGDEKISTRTVYVRSCRR